MKTSKLLDISFLILLITGCFTFLVGMSYYEQNIIFVSLTQLMAGGGGLMLNA